VRRLSLVLAAAAAAVAISAPSAQAAQTQTVGSLCNGNNNTTTLNGLAGFNLLFSANNLCDILALRHCLNSVSNLYPGQILFAPCVRSKIL
jgi:hypothetical protein